MGAIDDGIKSINNRLLKVIDDIDVKIRGALTDISGRLKGAIGELDLKVKGLTGQLNTHFKSLQTRLTNLLPKSMRPKVKIPVGNYTDPIQKLAKKQLTMKVKAPSSAATTGAASQALTETKPQPVGRSSEFGEKAGDRQESTKGKMPSKVAQWLENHKWIKK